MTFKWIIIECAEHYILLCYKERFLKQHYNAWMWKWIILTFKMNCTAFTRLLISNGFLLSASKQCLIFMTEFKWWLWTHFLREAETYFSFPCTLVALGSLSLNLCFLFVIQQRKTLKNSSRCPLMPPGVGLLLLLLRSQKPTESCQKWPNPS